MYVIEGINKRKRVKGDDREKKKNMLYSHPEHTSAKDKLCITAPPGVVAYSVTSTSISFFIVQQDMKTHFFEL